MGVGARNKNNEDSMCFGPLEKTKAKHTQGQPMSFCPKATKQKDNPCFLWSNNNNHTRKTNSCLVNKQKQTQGKPALLNPKQKKENKSCSSKNQKHIRTSN